MASGDTERCSSGDCKVKTMESDTPSVTSSSAASSASGDGGGKPKAGLVAAYFRDWQSRRVDTVDTSEDNGKLEGGEERDKQQGDPVEVEEEPVGTDNQETMERDEKKEFEVMYQCLPDVEEAEEEEVGGLRDRWPMQFLDVLLQTDVQGIGLNVGLERVGGGRESDGQILLVVQSFRRRSPNDVGPAEACGKIQVGDFLHAIDGEEVGSLQQLHMKLEGRLGKRRKFVLLRFLRPAGGDSGLRAPFIDQIHRTKASSETSWSEVDTLLHNNPPVAALVRQLATTNQVLQEQLIASQLEQEEQNIQLDQLHALYARTQAEGLPLFSLSKSIRPFARRSTNGGGSAKPIPTKIQTEVMEAVNAEYARLRQEFQMQHLLDKRELERKYNEKAQKLEEANTKKVEMLEAGFQQALEHYASGHHCSSHGPSTTSADVMESTTDAFLQQCNRTDETTDTAEQIKFGPNEEKFASYVKLEQIRALLTEYESFKCVRATKLKTLGSIRVDSIPSELRREI